MRQVYNRRPRGGDGARGARSDPAGASALTLGARTVSLAEGMRESNPSKGRGAGGGLSPAHPHDAERLAPQDETTGLEARVAPLRPAMEGGSRAPEPAPDLSAE